MTPTDGIAQARGRYQVAHDFATGNGEWLFAGVRFQRACELVERPAEEWQLERVGASRAGYTDAQNEACERLARNGSVFIRWPRAGGKTTFVCTELVEAARANGGRSYLLVAPARLGRHTFDTLRRAARYEFSISTNRRGMAEMRMLNGSTIEVMGEREPEVLRGLRYDGVAIDDELLIPPALVHAAMRCFASTPGFLITTRTLGENRRQTPENAEAEMIARAHLMVGETASDRSWRVCTLAYQDPSRRTAVQLALALAEWAQHPQLSSFREHAHRERERMERLRISAEYEGYRQSVRPFMLTRSFTGE